MKNCKVILDVQEPSTVELTAKERLRLERLERSEPDGYLPADDGRLLDTGTWSLALAKGVYAFRTLSEVDLQIVSGGVEVTSSAGKTGWPDPPRTTGSQGPLMDAGEGPVPGVCPEITVTDRRATRGRR